MGKLLLLFIVVPAVELALLFQVGVRIGLLPTVALIVMTGIVGASLARWQGLGVLSKMQAETAAGRLPTGSIFDGVIILIAGALLITPGILTDLVGFACLVPGTRALMKSYLRRRIEHAVREGRVHVSMHGQHGQPPDMGSAPPTAPPDHDEEIIDISANRPREE